MIHDATAAYRADIGSRAEAFGPHDDAWVAIASLMSQVCIVPEDERRPLIDAGVAIADSLISEETLRRALQSEWSVSERSGRESVLVLADQMYQAGALHLTRTLLDALLATDDSLTALQRGRALAKRARVDGRLGRMPEAADQYDQVARLGKQIDNAELRIRAWIGHGALAQMRGNYPEQMRYSRRAARLADRLGIRFLSRLAHSGLMVAAGARHEFEEALEHAREVYRTSVGDPIHEGEILQNIGQLLLEAGHQSAAADVFANVLSRPLPIRIMLPALGGFAIASASAADAHRVGWVRSELDRLEREGTAPPYPLASALLECASALFTLRQAVDADQVLASAVRIAGSRGFHEITVKADAMRDARQSSRPEKRPASIDAARFVEEIDVSGAKQLPRHVTLLATPF